MACHSCSQPNIEGFTEMPQHEYFNDANKSYSCQTQATQPCVYTAQGEMVCNFGSTKKSPEISGSAFFERFTNSQDKKEGFPRAMGQ
jgi:hypothetical protein